jgi:hypothetical protein
MSYDFHEGGLARGIDCCLSAKFFFLCVDFIVMSVYGPRLKEQLDWK